MRLVYKDSQKEVKVGDVVKLDNRIFYVRYFEKPHKPSSSGKISIAPSMTSAAWQEYYVSVVGAVWIEREDQQ